MKPPREPCSHQSIRTTKRSSVRCPVLVATAITTSCPWMCSHTRMQASHSFAPRHLEDEREPVFKAHRLVYHSSLDWGVIKKNTNKSRDGNPAPTNQSGETAGTYSHEETSAFERPQVRVTVVHLGRSTCHAVSGRGD